MSCMIVTDFSDGPSPVELPSNRTLQRFVTSAATHVPLRGEVSILLTTDDIIRKLNRKFRGKNKPTDVLSFPARSLGPVEDLAGDLAISVETAARQARNFGHPLATELKVLILHGMLHLAGLDHETDAGEMLQREAELRRKFRLPLGLIERTGPPPASRRRA